MAAVGLLTVTVSQLSTTSRVAPPTMGAAAHDAPPLATHVIKTSTRLLWYLRGTLVGLAFFDSKFLLLRKFRWQQLCPNLVKTAQNHQSNHRMKALGLSWRYHTLFHQTPRSFFAAGLTNSKNIFRACIL